MKEYKTKNLRNIGIVGHRGSGKTTITESILYLTKATDRFGKVEEGTTISDYDLEERKRKISISTTIAPCEWENIKINLIDTPGYFDFVGESIQGLRAADIVMIAVSGTSGIQVGTEKAWKYVNENKLPKAFYINKLDRENSNFDKVLSGLKDKFGISVVPIQYPIGYENNFKGVVNVISRRARIYNPKTREMQESQIPSEIVDRIDECKKMIVEAVAETDEILLDKYIEQGTLSDEEIYHGLIKGCTQGDIAPVMCGSAYKNIGTETLLEDIVECFPSPENCSPKKARSISENKDIKISINEKAPFSAFVFKTLIDPFVGRLSIFKVLSGNIKSDSIVFNSSKGKCEKVNAMYFLRGRTQIPVDEIIAGDIGAVSKLQFTSTGDTLCTNTYNIKYEKMEFPVPNMSMAIVAKSKKDEDKISTGLSKLMQEDLTVKVFRDVENAQTILSGIGETHLDVIASKLKNKFGVEVTLELPKIPYRETIRNIADVQGKHKKQSGGHGQYGDVRIKFEPRYDGDELEFIDKVVGGAVPRQYIPAVEKGLKDCICHGVLAGYPVIRLKASLHDGSYHAVDSSEMAFKVAASIAYKKGLLEAQSILLEPIMHVEIDVPEDYMGDIIGDINKKRGRVLGMQHCSSGERVIAEVPQAEMFKYAINLRSITQARGEFSIKFERYEEVPSLQALKIIDNAKKLQSIDL